MSWQPGDVGIIDGSVTHPQWNGATVKVLSYPYEEMSIHSKTRQTYVDIDALPRANANIRILRKPYNGHDKCSWEDVKKVCDWMPDEVVIYE